MSNGISNSKWRALARRIVPAPVRRWARGGGPPASAGYAILDGAAPADLTLGWRDADVAERQQAAFAPLLRQLRAGRPREDFAALARAVGACGIADPRIIEIGCGSGWNFEVIEVLGGRRPRYVGLDCSAAMVALGQRTYPRAQFVVGDAVRLPFADGAGDLAISGTVLMHLPDYPAAIRETRRVARRWCIFHTVPVLAERATTTLRKRAYGAPVVEIIFRERDLKEWFGQAGLRVVHAIDSLPYNLESVLGEPTTTRTYVCAIR